MTLDFRKLLDQTIYSIDTLSLLGDIADFLKFAEETRIRQREPELAAAIEEGNATKFDADNAYLESQYRAHLVQSVEYRFDISLAQRIRYSALTGYITSIEWCALGMRRRAQVLLPDAPIPILRRLVELTGMPLKEKLEDLENLIFVRNCVVHSAGILDTYKHQADLRSRVAVTPGFKIAELHFMGDGIHIEPGALENRIEDAKEWLPSLDKECTEQSILK